MNLFFKAKNTESELYGDPQLAHRSPTDVNSTMQLRGAVAGTAGNTERSKLYSEYPSVCTQEASHLEEESTPTAFTEGRMRSDANTEHKTALGKRRDQN